MKVNMGSMHPRTHSSIKSDHKIKSSDTTSKSLITQMAEILDDPEIATIDVTNILQDYLGDVEVDLDDLSTQVVTYIVGEIKAKSYPKLNDAVWAEVESRLRQKASRDLMDEKRKRGEWMDPEELHSRVGNNSKKSSSYKVVK